MLLSSVSYHPCPPLSSIDPVCLPAMTTFHIARESCIHGPSIRSQTLPISQEIRQRGRAGFTKQRIANQIKTTVKNGVYNPRAEEKVLHYARRRTRLESPNLFWARLKYHSHISCDVEHRPISSVELSMLPSEPFGPLDERPPIPKKSYRPRPTNICANTDLEPTEAPISEMDVLSQQLEAHHMEPTSGRWREISSSRLRENCFGQLVLKNSWREKVSEDILTSLIADWHIAMGDD